MDSPYTVTLSLITQRSGMRCLRLLNPDNIYEKTIVKFRALRYLSKKSMNHLKSCPQYKIAESRPHLLKTV